MVGLRMKISGVNQPKIEPCLSGEALNKHEESAFVSQAGRLFLACCGELSPAWDKILLTLYNSFGWLPTRYNGWSEFSSETAETGRLDILVITSDQLAAFRRDYDQEHHIFLQNTWLMVQVEESQSWHMGPNSPKLIASFSRDTTEEDLLYLFSKVLRDWALAKGKQCLPAMASIKDPDRNNEGLSVGGTFVRTLESISSLVKIRKSVFGLAGAEPYLSIILQVAHATHKSDQVDLTSLGAELEIPISTLTRKLDYLCDVGLLVRSHDGDDRRRIIIQLTELGLEKVRRYVNYVVSIL